jgi:hypothetical protein
VFDTLTTLDLYRLHGTLCDQIHAIHDRMLKLTPGTEPYRLLRAHVNELHETCTAAYTESQRRDQETAHA